MTLYTLSIRRPVLAIVMSITIVLFGLLGFSFLGVREFPSLDPPNISVSTSYRGASADVIASPRSRSRSRRRSTGWTESAP